jgi:hypothetical protein
MMQEFVRKFFDDVLDREEAGEEVEKPNIYTIPKGTHKLSLQLRVTRIDNFRRDTDTEPSDPDQRASRSIQSAALTRDVTSRYVIPGLGKVSEGGERNATN